MNIESDLGLTLTSFHLDIDSLLEDKQCQKLHLIAQLMIKLTKVFLNKQLLY